MATVNQQPQSPGVSAAASSAAQRRATPLPAESAEKPAPKAYPVLLRLADVSPQMPVEELVHITPLMISSALETIGSGGATGAQPIVSSAPRNNAAEPTWSTSTATVAVNTARPAAEPTYGAPTPMASAAPASTAPVTSAGRDYQRIDKPVQRPVRRQFRMTRPAFLPEIPPTLILGLLVCFSAVLVGMLWRGNRAESYQAPNTAQQPASTPPVAGSASGSQVVVVPEVPPINAGEAPGKNGAPAGTKTATAPSTKKVSRGKVRRRPTEPAATKIVAAPKPAAPAGSLPAPQITGIRPLPPVEAVSPNPFYGQPVGGPAPHIVDNPFSGDPNTVYEARRPAAQFQGTITKPETGTPNERY